MFFIKTLVRALNLVFLSCAVASAYTVTGQERGNGGDVLICNKNKIIFFDIYEGQRKNLIYKPSTAKTLTAKVDDLLLRLKFRNPERQKMYSNWSKDFFSETLLTTEELVDIPDTGLGLVPEGCVIRQLVVQIKPNSINKQRYYINLNLWNKLDDNQKAAVITHELFLRESISSSISLDTSVYVRHFNQLLLADQFNHISNSVLAKLYQEAKFINHEYHNLIISPYDNSTLPATQSQLYAGFEGGFHSFSNKIHILKASKVRFPRGLVMLLNYDDPENGYFYHHQSSNKMKLFTLANKFYLHQDGQIQLGTDSEIVFYDFFKTAVRFKIGDLIVDGAQYIKFSTADYSDKDVITIQNLNGIYNKRRIENASVSIISDGDTIIYDFK
jgi:hypothetical protein